VRRCRVWKCFDVKELGRDEAKLTAYFRSLDD